MKRSAGTLGGRQTWGGSTVAALVALGCLLAVLVVVGGRPGNGATPSSSATLIAGSDSSSRCPSVSIESVLEGSDLAVSGTVVKSTARGVVLQIDHVYRGKAELRSLTISRGAGAASSVRATSVWTKGQRQLVAASGGVVIECVGGATVPWDQETADEYARVLG